MIQMIDNIGLVIYNIFEICKPIGLEPGFLNFFKITDMKHKNNLKESIASNYRFEIVRRERPDDPQCPSSFKTIFSGGLRNEGSFFVLNRNI